MDKNDQNQQKPWDASFEEEDAVKKYSRTANRKKTKRVSLVVGLLMTVILLLAFVPVYNYLKELNQPNANNQTTAVESLSSENKTTTSTSKVVNKSSSAKKASSEKAASKKAASEKAASEQAAKESSEAAAKSSSEAAQSTVKLELPADRPTLYGFAAQNNVTVEQLYSLNPGLTADNYSQWVGRDVKIK